MTLIKMLLPTIEKKLGNVSQHPLFITVFEHNKNVEHVFASLLFIFNELSFPLLFNNCSAFFLCHYLHLDIIRESLLFSDKHSNGQSAKNASNGISFLYNCE
jgi:hypothetical protein